MRLKITLAYVGTGYAGWQRQADAPTVQGTVEAAAAAISRRPIAVHGASRTDAGVHAERQVAHVDVGDRLEPADWLRALNAHLPADVRVVASEIAPDAFHARHSAAGKEYRYQIDNRPVASPFDAAIAWHVAAPLDFAAMRAAAAHLVGPVDQRAFSTQPVDRGRPVRPIDAVGVAGAGGRVTLTVAGRSFLRYAVRGMVGTLVEVGQGRRPPDSLAELARSGQREAAGATAPPHGLCLTAVHYGPSAAPEPNRGPSADPERPRDPGP